jgi:hypothetical protein
MKRLQNISLIALIIIVSACAGSTKIVSTWKADLNSPLRFNKIGVVVIFPEMESRTVTEEALEDEFTAKEINAISTFNVFPLAGKLPEIQESIGDPEVIREGIRKKVSAHNIDALLFLSLFNIETEQRYVEGSNFVMGGTGYYGSAYPYAGRSYYDYYAYSATTIYRSGYYVEDVTYYIECSLFDVETEEMLWTIQTKTVNVENLEYEAQKYAQLVVNELLTQNIITP